MSQTETPQLQDALARLSQIVNNFHLPDTDTENETNVAKNTVEEHSIRASGKMKACIEREMQLIDLQAEQWTTHKTINHNYLIKNAISTQYM